MKRHDNPNDPYCILLYKAFVIGMDIKPEYQVIHINFASVWFLLNAVRAIETGWVVYPKTLLYTLPMSTIGERSLEKFEDLVD
jgi:hypothetical protein